MAGIYIHIPFCRKACIYCNFHFSLSLRQAEDLTEAISREAILSQSYLNEPVDTVYFGGGTPSLLNTGLLQKILSTLEDNFSIASSPEITLEANPDDITAAGLEAWRKIGINRLSVGIQSFQQEELEWMNRAHSANQAKECLHLIRQAGFTNFSADLIYGSPLSKQEWLEENLEILLQANTPHLSCYALTTEPNTLLHKWIEQKKTPATDDDVQSKQFEYISEQLTKAGYDHYEISNFALPENRSRHNSSYWQGIPYLGLGPSAHSFDGKHTRKSNVANNSKYIELILAGKAAGTEEILSAGQQLNELIMISLRKMEGLDLAEVEKKFGMKEKERILQKSKPFIDNGLAVLSREKIILGMKGKLMADGIAAELFVS